MKAYKRTEKQTVFVAMLFLSCLLFSSCSSNNHDVNKETNNTFSGSLNKDKEINIGNQMLYPCHWSFTVEQDASGEATLISTADIDPEWHLYSQHISDKGSPTKFYYDDLPNYKLSGGTEEGISKKEFDPYLNIEILYFEKEAVFRQKIKVLSKKDFTITGTIDYSACFTQCVPSEEDFSFKVKGNPQGE